MIAMALWTLNPDTLGENSGRVSRSSAFLATVVAFLIAEIGDKTRSVRLNVMRGTVHPVRRASLTHTAREALQSDLEIPVVSLEDMYGGKLVAAKDRQHPRDLFDVMQLFAHEGITPSIRRAFAVYLASHNRPVHEELFPALRDLEYEYVNNLRGMTADSIPMDALLAALGAHDSRTAASNRCKRAALSPVAPRRPAGLISP